MIQSRTLIRDNSTFEQEYRFLAQKLLGCDPVRRGPAHATQDETMAETLELMHVTQQFFVDPQPSAWQSTVQPNLPWAEDHFQERIGGEPLNPSPSEAWWPFARQGNAEHKKDHVFSHTYPERIWPRRAGEEEDQGWDINSDTGRGHFGIRYRYGDLNDLIEVLKRNPGSRQAYLPIWFPEDLAAAVSGERVPCSMGYHFIVNGRTGELDCVYTLRSCDIVRFYRDDVYMAGRLLQHVAKSSDKLPIGNLILHIDNLHAFPGDRVFLRSLLPPARSKSISGDPRHNYDFGALG